MSPILPHSSVRTTRRQWLGRMLRGAAGGLLALALPARAALPDWVRRWNASAFEAHGESAVLAALGWNGPVRDDPGVLLQAPEIAESGAVVPVEVRCTLPGCRRIAVLVTDNPNTLAACFTLSPALAPRLATRIKLAETTTVVALVETEAGVFGARQEVKITIGGCGG